jgi:hypothetical protein
MTLTSDCNLNKDIKYGQITSEIMADKFLYVSLGINDQKVFTLIDTSINISMDSPSFYYLNINMNNSLDKNIIQLSQKDHTAVQIGYTYSLKGFNNNITVISKFEIIRDNVHVCIGMDLIPSLKILISRLVFDWGANTSPT